MAGYLIYRPSSRDKHNIGYGIRAMLVNGASSGAALTAAAVIANALCGSLGSVVSEWSTVLLNSSDLDDSVNGTVFCGEAVIPGGHLPGGGLVLHSVASRTLANTGGGGGSNSSI